MKLFLCLSAFYLISIPLYAVNKPTLLVPSLKGQILVDGMINESPWDHAAIIAKLNPALHETYHDKVAAVPTVIRVLWSPDFLYIAYDCKDNNIIADPTLKRDENIYLHDVVEFFIDPIGDQRQYWEVQVSPLNQILDLIFVCNATPKSGKDGVLVKPWMSKHLFGIREYSLPGLKTAVKKSDTGWTVEIAIPAKPLMKPLGKTQFEPMSLRANFLRYDRQLNEKGKPWIVHMNWSPVRHGCPHISPAAMGHLTLAAP